MQNDNLLTPMVAKFILRFPKRKKYTTDDIHHFPATLKRFCFGCSREMDLHLMGIGQDSRKPEKNYKKWVVTYDCDLCKNLQSFRYCTSDEELVFIPAKNPI